MPLSQTQGYGFAVPTEVDRFSGRMSYDYMACRIALEYQFGSGTPGKLKSRQHFNIRREPELNQFKLPDLVARAATRGFVEWAQNEIAVVPDFHKRILFSDEAHFWLNGYVNKQNCRIWSEANPQVYVETPLHPEKTDCLRCSLKRGSPIRRNFTNPLLLPYDYVIPCLLINHQADSSATPDDCVIPCTSSITFPTAAATNQETPSTRYHHQTIVSYSAAHSILR
ncbi:hypothetical protein TNCV_1036681 [Trichonephila clavipes]|nr:hypothetical protein TNCV_1036681 [Trichonephila clavipes]